MAEVLSTDPEIRTWELKAHHLQYFHEDTEDFDFTHVLKVIRKWIKNNDVNVQSVQVQYHVGSETQPDVIAGTVEYCI